MQNASSKMIKVGHLVPSGNNVRGKLDAKSLADLVSSVKEKGVLVPLIVRPREKNGHPDGTYEVVAGHRRLAAAKEAGVAEVPCQVREMSDAEAKEVQIVENLQRENVHPLDEAHAFRALIQSMQDVKAVAARVGKPEAYVKRRVALVQLCPEAVKAFRDGVLNEGLAELIAPLSTEGDQQKVVKVAVTKASDRWDRPFTVDGLADYIKKEFSTFLKRQPWLNDKAALAAVGPCKECPTNRDTLFGAAKEGECTTVACWQRKMDLFVKHVVSKHEGAPLITERYDARGKGMLTSSQYEQAGKKKCPHVQKAVYADGDKAGSVTTICASGSCKVHHPFGNSSAPLTPKERAAKKAEREKEKRRAEAEAERDRKAVDAALSGVQWPPSSGEMEVILHKLTDDWVDEDILVAILTRRGIEVPKERNDHTSDAKTDAVRAAFSAAEPRDKWRMIMEICVGDMTDDERKEAVKKFGSATLPKKSLKTAGKERK